MLGAGNVNSVCGGCFISAISQGILLSAICKLLVLVVLIS